MRGAVGLVGCALALWSSGVLAAGLMDAYQAARQNDPSFRAARYERDAGQYAIAIGRAGLLPNVGITGAYSRNRGERTYFTRAGSPTEDLDYREEASAIALRQPLFNYDSIVRNRQGGVQAAFSDAVFDRKEAEFAVRLASAYFEVLFSLERLALSDAEIAAYRADRETSERRRKGGEGTVTEVAEAESRLQLARAGRADAIDRLSVANLRLESMTGKAMAPLWPLRRDFAPSAVQAVSLDQWSALAEESSPEIRARRKSFEFASLEVDRNRAGHYPQLDFVARSSRTQGESLSTVDQKNVINSVGVQLNIPLFAGGRVDALTGQAVANRARAQAELDAAVNEVLIEVRKQFMAVETGGSKIAAYQKAVDASVVAVEGTLRGMRGGIRSNVDVLNAERVMFVARRDLAQARYEYLLSLLQLRAAAGVLSEKDLQEVASLLLPPE
ncbi:TolC family outer membrane protein [Accumulibacter sp.]|uniref:TolC family outer membrane protein n=1 Tax=Accumulibacter sp. TaxID=2053492 RepID=UPI0025DD5213|nr:TolC family outer membrane protein [Accumulibacter sp.]MCM8611239.1 TolC family outer membrane protein [Accumulibacter sp.]MCM8634687.1 TolC family outer membrane protein [Accumulibacter sp.]MCM8638774.1 TolC family outer membrane protein [Accumulibacter sp.]